MFGWFFFAVLLSGCAPAPGLSSLPSPEPVREPPDAASTNDAPGPRVVRTQDGPTAMASRIIAPENGARIPDDGFDVRWSRPAGALPSRLVVMVDNGPVRALFPGDTSASLQWIARGAVAAGPHRIVSCVTVEGRVARTEAGVAACDVVFIGVGAESVQEPGLFAPTPHGTYSGPGRTERIPLDVFVHGLSNAPSGHFVQLTIDGPDGRTTHRVEPGVAYALENLANGDYTLSMQLIGPGDVAVQGRWSNLNRVITTNADVADEAPMPAEPASSTP